jgi:hypothetical protein
VLREALPAQLVARVVLPRVPQALPRVQLQVQPVARLQVLPQVAQQRVVLLQAQPVQPQLQVQQLLASLLEWLLPL